MSIVLQFINKTTARVALKLEKGHKGTSSFNCSIVHSSLGATVWGFHFENKEVPLLHAVTLKHEKISALGNGVRPYLIHLNIPKITSLYVDSTQLALYK